MQRGERGSLGGEGQEVRGPAAYDAHEAEHVRWVALAMPVRMSEHHVTFVGIAAQDAHQSAALAVTAPLEWLQLQL